MEKVIYSNKGGLGLILDSEETEEKYIKPKAFLINGQELKPNDMTDLFGLFDKPVRYAGALKGEGNCMCFELGSDGNLFGSKTYYSCFYWLQEDRLLNKYTPNSARDYRYVNGKWK